MQYTKGTVNVTNGSAIVTGTDTSWVTDGIQSGWMFKIVGEPTIYTIASVNSNTQLQLSANYAGTTKSGVAYVIATDYTPTLGLAEVNKGDLDWTYFLNQDMRKLDTIMGPEHNLNGTHKATETRASLGLATTDSPTFNNVKLTSLSDGKVPYHVSDSSGFADSPAQVSGGNFGIGTSPTSKLDCGGSAGFASIVITSSATAGDYTTYFINCGSGQVTLTLPSASTCPHRIYNIIRIANSIYNCVISAPPSQTINGEYSWSLELAGEGITVQSDGSNWRIIERS